MTVVLANLGGVNDISGIISEALHNQIREKERKFYWEAGFEDARRQAAEIVGGWFSKESVARATKVFESLPDLPTELRLQHAIAALLGGRLLGDPRNPVGITDGDPPNVLWAPGVSNPAPAE